MFDLTFLGTSGSIPSVERNQPGLLIAVGSHRMLVDCGEGTQRQLLRSGAGFRRLDRLLLTHDHLDHVLGIPGLLSTLGQQRREEKLVIHGGPKTLRFVAGQFAALWGEGRAPIACELAGLEEGLVVEEDDFTISCFPIQHRNTDSFAFIFEAQARRHLLPDRLDALGVPGPDRKELAAGRAVTLADGRVIDPAAVTGAETPGAKLVVVGDVATTEGLVDHVRGADLLVIESSFLARDAETAQRYGHLTATEGATLAAEAGVKRLVLNHITGRYEDHEILAEAKAIFPEVALANDFDKVSI